MQRGLVGSEMCIRDRDTSIQQLSEAIVNEETPQFFVLTKMQRLFLTAQSSCMMKILCRTHEDVTELFNSDLHSSINVHLTLGEICLSCLSCCSYLSLIHI
eukprot:TRINITY_DN28039_c0_g1_i1.p1 TRINITY_DN28039_c0_g1~~TRINITY_DN28039_c0_g1_i1.p1  ORF type:complete len:101 (-),score=7.18 TRINITY_DN28039_c0_g1_i1:138-440(-)